MFTMKLNLIFYCDIHMTACKSGLWGVKCEYNCTSGCGSIECNQHTGSCM